MKRITLSIWPTSGTCSLGVSLLTVLSPARQHLRRRSSVIHTRRLTSHTEDLSSTTRRGIGLCLLFSASSIGIHVQNFRAPRPTTEPNQPSMNATPNAPNHALQRTAPAVTLAASSLRLSAPVQPARQPPQSLSLGSLGVATRVVFNEAFLPVLSDFMSASTYPVVAPRSGSRCPVRQSVRSVAVQS